MRLILQIASWIALAATILPPIMYLLGSVSLDQTKSAMLLATVAWFAATPFWMGRKKNGVK